jgi:hypothetical protein
VLTTVRVLFTLGFVELLIRWVPVRRLGRLLGAPVSFATARPDAARLTVAELPPRAQRQLRCTQRVAAHWPSANGPCLRRSLVAGHLLRDHHPSVRLGVGGQSTDDLAAHAWLEIDQRPLEDVQEFRMFTMPASPAR